MEPEAFARRAESLANRAAVASCPTGFAGVRVREEARRHALLPDRHALVEVARTESESQEGAPRWALHVYHGSFAAEATAARDFDVEDMLQRAVSHAAERLAEYAEAVQVIESEEALFEEHARFRRGLPVAPAWYSRGQRLAPGVWAVDLDLFLEVTMRRSEWEALRGQRIVLQVLGEDLEVELPADATPDEAWSLEGAGLFEPAADVEAEDLAVEAAGRYGDLHIVPFAF